MFIRSHHIYHVVVILSEIARTDRLCTLREVVYAMSRLCTMCLKFAHCLPLSIYAGVSRSKWDSDNILIQWDWTIACALLFRKSVRIMLRSKCNSKPTHSVSGKAQMNMTRKMTVSSQKLSRRAYHSLAAARSGIKLELPTWTTWIIVALRRHGGCGTAAASLRENTPLGQSRRGKQTYDAT